MPELIILDVETEDNEAAEQQAEMAAMREQQLALFSNAISIYRDDAIDDRKISGIEEIWDEDEDAYEGIDNANREEEVNRTKLVKTTLETAFTGVNKKKSGGVRSTVLLNITRPYVDGASARTSDMLLPNDDRNWSYKPTPISESAESALNGKFGPEAEQYVKQAQSQAQSKLKMDQRQVDDWLDECNYTREVRSVIEDCAKVGTGVLKGPTPEKRRSSQGYDIKPASHRVDYRNIYPAPGCGENIQDGKFIFERDHITVKKVKELIGLPGYMEEQINVVLREGPGKRLNEADNDQPLRDSELYEIWYFHGLVSSGDLESCRCAVGDDQEMVFAMVTMINNTVISANLPPTDEESFPYDIINWQKRKNFWAGIGVSRQIRTPQRMLTAANRNMMDNASISAGAQIIFIKDVIRPENGSYELTPNKQWFAENDVDIRSVKDAFVSITFPSLQPELAEIIQFALRMAEDVTGLPQLMQGSQGSAPDTVGGMTMLNNNANTVLRRIARNFDDYITIPHVKRYYQWQIMYDGAQGDYQITAMGSSALVERDIQNQAIQQMGDLVLNPAFGVNPEKWMTEYLKSMKFDPKRFTNKDDEEEKGEDVEKQQMAQQLQAMDQELKSRQSEKQAELEFKYAELNQSREIQLMKISLEKGIKLEELKVKLGINVNKSQDEMKLKAIEQKIKLHEANTRRLATDNDANELSFKLQTGRQGI